MKGAEITASSPSQPFSEAFDGSSAVPFGYHVDPNIEAAEARLFPEVGRADRMEDAPLCNLPFLVDGVKSAKRVHDWLQPSMNDRPGEVLGHASHSLRQNQMKPVNNADPLGQDDDSTYLVERSWCEANAILENRIQRILVGDNVHSDVFGMPSQDVDTVTAYGLF